MVRVVRKGEGAAKMCGEFPGTAKTKNWPLGVTGRAFQRLSWINRDTTNIPLVFRELYRMIVQERLKK